MANKLKITTNLGKSKGIETKNLSKKLGKRLAVIYLSKISKNTDKSAIFDNEVVKS